MASRILVIDRDSLRREAYAKGLQAAGYRAETFESGSEGIRFLLGNVTDGVVVDFGCSYEPRNPVSAGKRIVRELTQADAFVPLILLCERSDDLDHETSAGADMILRHPVSNRALTDTVAGLLKETLRERAQRKSGYIFAFR